MKIKRIIPKLASRRFMRLYHNAMYNFWKKQPLPKGQGISRQIHSTMHEHLLKIMKTFPQDYEPWGKVTEKDRAKKWIDCSSGCVWYIPLEEKLGADWGVCTNPKSHRVGLLTFEHQGCLEGST